MVMTVRPFVATEAEFGWTSPHTDLLSSYDPTCARPASASRAASIGGGPEALGDHREAADSGSRSGASTAFASLARPDRSVAENAIVRCPIVRPASAREGEVLERACVLIHGLNERGWDKYLGWARALADKAGCAVILFPIAFHMDRSPALWADFGAMRAISKDRVARKPGIAQSSVANAAISERLDDAPARLYLSGLMAARDLGDLLAALRSGEIPGIASGARMGFFGYSIGAFLLQCLTLADPDFVEAGRRFLFCGGPHLSAMTPVSKYIIDSHAHRRIIDFWVRGLEAELEGDPGLACLLDSPEGRAFLAMVDPDYPQMDRLAAFSDGGTAVASLSADDVMPRQAILDFFEGTGVAPAFLDLPSCCTHIAPFDPRGGAPVATAFQELFDRAAEYLFS